MSIATFGAHAAVEALARAGACPKHASRRFRGPPAAAIGLPPAGCTMSGIAFDTLAAARALREAGFGDRQAEAVTGVVRRAVGAERDSLATKADLETGLATLRADIYRALWAQGAGLVAVMTALNAAFELSG